jgi:uncharacterized RDD family membrane protein YckC
VLKDPSVSRNHALLVVQDGQLSVKDLGSTNGSYVNGRRLDEGLMRLHSGDRLTIGESDLIVGVTGEAPVEDPNLVTRRMDPDGVRCPHCGDPLDLTLTECIGCGKSLLDEPMAETSAPTRERSLPPVVEILQQPEPRREENAPPAPAPLPATALELPPPQEPQPDTGENPAAPPPETTPDEAPPSVSPDAPPPPAPAESPAETRVEPAGAPVTPPPIATAPEPPHPAGFGRRLVAALVDGLCFLGVGVAISFLQGGPLSAAGQSLLNIVTFALSILVPTFGWSLWGTTPGKALVGLVVCTREGRVGIPPGRALLRLVGYLASTLTLGVGFLMIAFTEGHRGLHDILAGTYVGRRPR